MAKPLVEYILKLDDTIPQIGKKISKSLTDEMNKVFRSVNTQTKIINQVRLALSTTLTSSPTYQGIITPGDPLHHQLGIQMSKPKMDAILTTWTNSVNVNISSFRQVGNYGMTGTINIWGVQADYGDVLGTPASEYVSVNAQRKATLVPWLEWLLLRGRSFVAPGHIYVPGGSRWSRTNEGLMRKAGSKISWQVPSEHSGVAENNWVTRAILGQDGGDGIGPEIAITIDNILRGK